MGNYVLTLHHNRCPDGAEFVPHPWIEGTTMRVPMKLIKKKGRAGLPEGQREWPVICFRSERREDYRRRLETPDKLMVTEFLNTVPWVEDENADPDTEQAMDYGPMLEFIGNYGFPLDFVSRDQLMQEAKSNPAFRDKLVSASRRAVVSEPDEEGNREFYGTLPPEAVAFRKGELPLMLLIEIRESLGRIWEAYEAGNLTEAVKAFRDNAMPQISTVYPDIEFRGGRPTLTLPIGAPYGFMLMETALVMTGGSQVMRCAKCGTIFVTGSGTGRRGTSVYCSNRCRVAAQRAKPEVSQARPRSVPASRR